MLSYCKSPAMTLYPHEFLEDGACTPSHRSATHGRDAPLRLGAQATSPLGNPLNNQVCLVEIYPQEDHDAYFQTYYIFLFFFFFCISHGKFLLLHPEI